MRLLVASLSGQSDAQWAQTAADYVDGAILGGIALDEKARRAARRSVEDRNRNEFLPSDPLEFIDKQLTQLTDTPIRPGINIRSTTVDPIRRTAETCASHNAILEINAHCRQQELCAAGCGEALLADSERLRTFVKSASATDAPVSVKVRAEVSGVDLVNTAKQIETAGADIIHIDAMDSEAIVSDVAAETDLFLIANNGVRGRESVSEYLEYGADAVSVGRPSTMPRVLQRVHDAVEEWGTAHERPLQHDMVRDTDDL